VVADSQIFKFSTKQCMNDPEKAQDAMDRCCEVCGMMWDVDSLTVRFWDSLDGPWLDDWTEATQDSFYVEIESDDYS